MLLGKRQRPPMKRTTSMTEFSLDLNHTTTIDGGRGNSQSPHDHHSSPFNTINPPRSTDGTVDPRFFSPTVTSKIHRRNSADYTQTSHFLRACHLCNRQLIAGRDIFMYRGDSAFCSLECRQQQMNLDEKKDKCSMSTKTSVATTSSGASETVAAM
ncbi:FCS-Like Zinc finger 5 [Lactuca sativa]|uniref:FLZ-type domain-containing protein n=1 Tax=Lactuca sativa TaxID=4236 RepID=A0A9R1WSZ3_LACSA|nr:FCS-Like Zinc finger 5 [Lactuca sativa]KAJ0185709.1 hypothetical protein LSAT_V11C900471860 [Lactuca sativa]